MNSTLVARFLILADLGRLSLCLPYDNAWDLDSQRLYINKEQPNVLC